MMNNTNVMITVPRESASEYPVVIGSGILSHVLDDIQQQNGDRRICVLTDENCRKAGHLDTLVGTSETPHFVIDPPGEVSKNMNTVLSIITDMEKRKLGRDSLLIALGGGTVGDIGGFAAAVFKRGIPCVQIPTTTVSQADSAVGGKVGVDSGLSKNAYGAFKNPLRVYIDTAVLKTLDDRHYRAGLVESVKHGMIADSGYFEFFENELDRILDKDPDVLTHLAEKNCAIKGDVVARDPLEKNLRSILNFGHTIGHAVESASGYRMYHGEAVAVGILGACRISEKKGFHGPDIRRRAAEIFTRMNLNQTIPESLDVSALVDIMKRDKKSVNAQPRFVLLEDLGQPLVSEGRYVHAVETELVDDVLSGLIKDV